MVKFQKATEKPYGCLAVDLKQDTPDEERLKTGQLKDMKQDETTGEQRIEPSEVLDPSSEMCDHCGVCFGTPYYLHMHLQNGCTMEGEDDVDEDDNNNPWTDLLQLAFDANDRLYRAQVEQYMNKGLEEMQATRKASHKLLREYRKSLMH